MPKILIKNILFTDKKVSMEEGDSLVGGTAASLVQEAVGGGQAADDAIKQVGEVSFVCSVIFLGCEEISAKIKWCQKCR